MVLSLLHPTALRIHLLFSAVVSLITGGMVQPPMMASLSRRALSRVLSAPRQMSFTLIPAEIQRVDEFCPLTHVDLIAYALLSILVQNPPETNSENHFLLDNLISSPVSSHRYLISIPELNQYILTVFSE